MKYLFDFIAIRKKSSLKRYKAEIHLKLYNSIVYLFFRLGYFLLLKYIQQQKYAQHKHTHNNIKKLN